jgi:hypothetical protein
MEHLPVLGDKVQDGNGINDGHVRGPLCLCRKLLDASEDQNRSSCNYELKSITIFSVRRSKTVSSI